MIVTYLIKSTLCLAVFLLFYKLVLENSLLHHFKRYYLLFAVGFATAIPLVTFTYDTNTTVEEAAIVYQSTGEEFSKETIPVAAPATNYTQIALVIIYTLGFSFFTVRFTANLVRLKRKISKAHLLPKKGFTLVLLKTKMIPHSFFKWIFLNENEYHQDKIPKEVLAHEATHVRQKHSWDILFIELIQVIFWFNPLIWLSRNTIKLNHEFLADKGALNEGTQISTYQNLLLSYSSCAHHTSLESPFNYSLTKKRIVMLSKSFNRKTAILKTLLVIPLVALCLFLFNNEIVAQSQNTTDLSASELDEVLNLELNTAGVFLFEGKELDKQALDSLAVQQHITSALVKTDVNYPESLKKEKIEQLFELTRSSKSSFCVEFYTGNDENYASQFNTGAQRNGKKSLVIEIKNDQIWINGKFTPISKLKAVINEITKGWSPKEYAEAVRSFMFKGNSIAFSKKAEKEFQKTNYVKENPSAKLLPPPPPAPLSELPPPPPPPMPPSIQDHLLKMKKLGSIFLFNEEEISFDSALELVKKDKTLSIKTPLPYSNPPKTYISKS
ncbi:M56 family metallopeptidase [Dokdonia sp. Hel_I_53]|uniref:M56 family metallopeptidase n=1 Tax=Dokdonia sp. Hel_I_53 TaxID=1566287 RepID=UPI00119B9C39|nr:M56 family metallopeptidase [Dokdonia sp. Hel_I_53]TVZ52893.1 beta-lactamase regulating signal transducer with metallopeptidase domain [Dokdonia sp. Hel_I_53]